MQKTFAVAVLFITRTLGPIEKKTYEKEKKSVSKTDAIISATGSLKKEYGWLKEVINLPLRMLFITWICIRKFFKEHAGISEIQEQT